MSHSEIRLNVKDENSELESVILGIAEDSGLPRAINSKAIEAIKKNIYPSESELLIQLLALEKVLISNKINIWKPENIKGINQIFVRDLGFVIDDLFILARMGEESRKPELDGIFSILKMLEPCKIIYPPRNVLIEGGDVVLYQDVIFIGLTKRTNREAVSFLQELLPHKYILPFELKHDLDNPRASILHLDCAFQPVGEQSAILYPSGFISPPEEIFDIFGNDNIIHVTSDEMYQMVPNVLSISKSKVISCYSFTRINSILQEQGIVVVYVPFERVAVLGGLLRCSTLPLIRSS